ncbi:MAG TPA: hypothetical protein VES73_10620 [Lamprocystis sp. (in: g-proteobacteria)]|nr:hypothetical protein [Lamprocystis sp. (in: g-proteobacteria)]
MTAPRPHPTQTAPGLRRPARRRPLPQRLAAWLLAALAACLLSACTDDAQATDQAVGADPDPRAAPTPAQPPTRPFPRIEAGQHTAPIRRIGVDAQGRWLVTASHDKTARVWDLRSGDLLRVLRPPLGEGDEGKLYAAAMTPDGSTVAVGGWTSRDGLSNAIYLFDCESGRLRHRIGGLPDRINHLAFSPDGSRLAAALRAGGVRLYAADTWTEVQQDQDYGARSLGIAFDRQGRIAATEYGVGGPGRLHLYDATLKPIAQVDTPGGSEPVGVAFSPDGSRIAVGYDDSTAVGLFSGSDLSALPGPDTSEIDNGGLSSVAWSTDGRTLFAGGRFDDKGADTLLVAWPGVGTGRPARHRLATDSIMDLAALPDGRLVFGAADPAWGVWRDPTARSGETAHPGTGPAGTAPTPDAGPLPGRGPAILDFRRVGHVLRLSADGMVADVD